jgi:hypothetical protein
MSQERESDNTVVTEDIVAVDVVTENRNESENENAAQISAGLAEALARLSRRTALKERGATLCPWCEGSGERVREAQPRVVRVVCEPCEGTGEADRWQGPAADDWRHRDSKATEAARWWRDHFPNETKKGATKSVAVESARDEARAGGGQ